MSQPPLLEIPEQPAVTKTTPPRPRGPAKLQPIDREQSFWRPVVVEELVPPEHKVRAIWDLTGQLDLSAWLTPIRSRQGRAGRAAWDPRLLLSVWIYAYSEQVSSAREIERLMAYEPGLMWLAGLGQINYHTLADFRAEYGEQLKQLLVQLLGVLSQAGYVKLERVAHDGTKVRAQAGADSFRGEKTLREELAKAEEVVKELEKASEGEAEGGQKRREAARRRAAEERRQKMELAVTELEKIRGSKKTEGERESARVSLTEPESRVMKHGDNAMAPSYNVQISTDDAAKIIVGVQVTQCSSDSGSLLPAMEEIHANLGKYPQQVVADGGYGNQANIVGMKDKQIDFYSSLPEVEVRQAASMKAAGIDPGFGPSAFVILEQTEGLRCPAGKTLAYVGKSQKREDVYARYQVQGGECQDCEFQKQCCPRRPERGRMVSIRISEHVEEDAFREKMGQAEAQAIYRTRGEVAEFPHCWIKEKLGMRKLRLRGLAKATIEVLWGVLTYNVLQYLRLRPAVPASAAV
jgi:transposase